MKVVDVIEYLLMFVPIWIFGYCIGDIACNYYYQYDQSNIIWTIAGYAFYFWVGVMLSKCWWMVRWVMGYLRGFVGALLFHK